MDIEHAWMKWWEGLGHVARLNRDKPRTREAFEAGYLAALERNKNEQPADERPHQIGTRDAANPTVQDIHVPGLSTIPPRPKTNPNAD